MIGINHRKKRGLEPEEGETSFVKLTLPVRLDLYRQNMTKSRASHGNKEEHPNSWTSKHVLSLTLVRSVWKLHFRSPSSSILILRVLRLLLPSEHRPEPLRPAPRRSSQWLDSRCRRNPLVIGPRRMEDGGRWIRTVAGRVWCTGRVCRRPLLSET